MTPNATPIQWLEHPEKHDYGAAEEYLSLVMSPKHAKRLAKKLRKGELHHWKAKDILRASEQQPLPADNPGVAAKFAKIAAGEPLSPVLLVRREDDPLIIADGYHRISTAYLSDENSEVPAVEVDAD